MVATIINRPDLIMRRPSSARRAHALTSRYWASFPSEFHNQKAAFQGTSLAVSLFH